MEGKENTYIDLAAVLTAAINFLIVAAVVYFVIVLPLNTLKARRKSGEESGPPSRRTSSCSRRSATCWPKAATASPRAAR